MSERLHAVARVVAAAGAIGAVGLTLYAGRGNRLPLLMVLMAGWVFAPFFGYAVTRRLAERWSSSTRVALDVVILVIAAGSLAVYIYDLFGPPHVRRATPYVAVPIAAWLLMAIVVSITALVARRRDVL